jgi:hypothetical protein
LKTFENFFIDNDFKVCYSGGMETYPYFQIERTGETFPCFEMALSRAIEIQSDLYEVTGHKNEPVKAFDWLENKESADSLDIHR